MTNQLQANVYTPMVPEASSLAKVLMRLGEVFILFYINKATNELRARAIGSPQILTLAEDALHCHGFVFSGSCYLYVVFLDGSVQLITYRYFGDPAPPTITIPLGITAIYLHAMVIQGFVAMAIDDGGAIYLATADNPQLRAFTVTKVYSNSMDPRHYVSTPVIGIHPSDFHAAPAPSTLTVGVQSLELSTGITSVGFFTTQATL